VTSEGQGIIANGEVRRRGSTLGHPVEVQKTFQLIVRKKQGHGSERHCIANRQIIV
jgi:hypothetical protein